MPRISRLAYKYSRVNSHTYVSEAHSSISTIDHILCHNRFLDAFLSAKVLEDSPLNTSDHLPLSARVKVTLAALPIVNPPSADGSVVRANWSKLSPSELKVCYTAPLEHAVSRSPSPSVLDCASLIDSSISNLIILMKKTSNKGLPARKYAKHILPGWSDALKSAHSDSKLAFCRWKSAGKPQSPENPLRAYYKSKKCSFRSLLRRHRHAISQRRLSPQFGLCQQRLQKAF